MQHPAKIQFSAAEQSLMQNAEWILTKNAIMEKMKWLLQQCQDAQTDLYKANDNLIPPEVLTTSPKISRGENYLGLPWLMLDHPRHFNKDGSMAIRTFFWWGNFFSITIHLSGSYKKMFAEKIISKYEMLQREELFICTGEGEWDHHFENTNYCKLKGFTSRQFEQTIEERNFIKLSAKIELSQWENLCDASTAFSKKMLEILA